MERPATDLPFAMATGVLAVTTLYLLANVAYLSVLPADQIAGAPQDRVGTAELQAMFGDAGPYLMTVAIMISTFGCSNGLILAGARAYSARARDNLFFRRTGELDLTHRTPAFALGVQAVWTSVLCLSGTYSQLLEFVIFAAVLFYPLTPTGLFALRARRPDLRDRYVPPAIPGFPACTSCSPHSSASTCSSPARRTAASVVCWWSSGSRSTSSGGGGLARHRQVGKGEQG
jgi:APA family basic amino acid/polyamine antiporter